MSLFGNKKQTTNDDDEATDVTENLGEEYYVSPVDPIIHTPENPFCDDMTCPCHDDTDAINDLNDAYQGGLVSREDADRIYRGRTI
jgi:hypothetical protein